MKECIDGWMDKKGDTVGWMDGRTDMDENKMIVLQV